MKTQRGAALLVLTVVMILTVVILMVGKNSRNESIYQRNDDINNQLDSANEAMIAVAVSNMNLPGMLIYPDRSTGDSNFNGRSDCSNTVTVYPLNPALFIGRLPYVDQEAGGAGCDALILGFDIGQTLRDPLDPLLPTAPNTDPNPLHYVVSRNLIEYENAPTINAINANVLTENAGWLTVFDENGNTLSNRIAFIIFHPGPALAGQNRVSPTAIAAQYLDSFTVPGVGVVNNAVSDAFGRYVAANETPTFNDKLVYVTADALMLAVEDRILDEFIRLLQLYNTANAGYPADIATLLAQPVIPPFPAAPVVRPNPPAYLDNWINPATTNTYIGQTGVAYGPSITYAHRTDCEYLGTTTGCGTPPTTNPYPAGVFHDVLVCSNVVQLGSRCRGIP